MEDLSNGSIAQLWSEESHDLRVVERGEWENTYKDYSRAATIVQHTPSGRHFRITVNRCGSYYSDYEFSEPEVCEVEAKEVVITTWVEKT